MCYNVRDIIFVYVKNHCLFLIDVHIMLMNFISTSHTCQLCPCMPL